VVICLERGADLHMAQLMPLPLTVSCFSKIQISFTFLVPAHPGSPGQRAVKRVSVCVCVCVCVVCVCVCMVGCSDQDSEWSAAVFMTSTNLARRLIVQRPWRRGSLVSRILLAAADVQLFYDEPT